MLFLNDGNDIPQLGVVGYRMDSNEDTVQTVSQKLTHGIRHFEITELFGNGHVLVEGFFSSGEFSRSAIYVTLKIWPKDRKHHELVNACRDTLNYVGLKYADLVLVHAPLEVGNRVDQWRALEELVQEEYARSIGITNITALQLADLLKSSNILPAVFEVRAVQTSIVLHVTCYAAVQPLLPWFK